ncbi:MAG: hypothetical protein MI739_06695 [Bacteroidales bacterium]|nr:hypothetical protein [Bacteroidales bacterium]
MKKIILISLIFFNSLFIFSQSIYVDNALMLSTNKYGGTARFIGMGGALGALGGDFSSLLINPAGLGVYRSSEFIVSPGLSYNNNNSTYIGNKVNDGGYNANINSLGFVASGELKNNSRWTNVNVAIGFNRTNNLNDKLTFEGINNSTIMEIFVNNTIMDTINFDALGNNEYLLFHACVLDTANGRFFNEIDNQLFADSNNFKIRQRKIMETEGSANEFHIAFGANYSHKLYVGASLGITWLNYKQYSSHYERDIDEYPIDNFTGFDFREYSSTSGAGVNFKIGAIYKPVDFLRVGVSVHTPTFYSLEQTFHNEAYSYFDNGEEKNAKQKDQNYNYKLQTPLRLNGSLGFQLGKLALIGFDYEYADYSKMELEDDYMEANGVIADNSVIKDVYQSTHNFRLGAEARLGTLYLRAGGAYSTNPYKYIDDYNVISFTGGIGYRDTKYFFDAAFSQRRSEYNLSAYSIQRNTALAQIKNRLNNFVVTFGVRF